MMFDIDGEHISTHLARQDKLEEEIKELKEEIDKLKDINNIQHEKLDRYYLGSKIELKQCDDCGLKWDVAGGIFEECPQCNKLGEDKNLG